MVECDEPVSASGMAQVEGGFVLDGVGVVESVQVVTLDAVPRPRSEKPHIQPAMLPRKRIFQM